VFASFSNFQKLEPGVFGVWCAVLRRVPHAVLWLLQHDGYAVRACVGCDVCGECGVGCDVRSMVVWCVGWCGMCGAWWCGCVVCVVA
jgi:hypothetical protein